MNALCVILFLYYGQVSLWTGSGAPVFTWWPHESPVTCLAVQGRGAAPTVLSGGDCAAVSAPSPPCSPARGARDSEERSGPCSRTRTWYIIIVIIIFITITTVITCSRLNSFSARLHLKAYTPGPVGVFRPASKLNKPAWKILGQICTLK